ncbi:DUF5667 domain-containing protein [Nocardioides sp. SYSU D00065]|uniref:DUF5667 domain-containing protein n=1 Tax=Nocardioides sp. SYSU D00065 TaxID=2817378 RepID=UPI001B32B4D6|nr:DUF5667 domain-containing protein [Nocardioides sp. SYSU D00065]
MTPPFSARRRADEFEALLSRRPGTPLSERDSAQFAALLDVVADLRSLPELSPRPEFVSSLRERLMAEADTALVPQPATPARLAMPASTRTPDRRLAAVLGGAALVGAAATMAVAAQSALPGESLYGVKRGIESAQVRLADDEAARGRTLLAQAETRLAELEELAGGDGGTEQLIPQTLDTFTEQSGDGVRSLLVAYDAGGAETDVAAARLFTATSLERLEALEPELPTSARDELLAAGQTLSDLDIEVSTACAACTGGITSTPEFLLTSSPPDLLAGLDPDELTLETAPVSAQDLEGITVPEELQAPEVLPARPSTPLAPPQDPTTPLSPTTPSPITPTKPNPTSPPTTPVTPLEDVTDLTGDLTDGLTDTTSNLVDGVDGLTGGALGGLTSGLDDATSGLIGEVTGTVDGLTGGTLGNVTGGLLPGRDR